MADFQNPERQRLVLIIESSLHFLARGDMTRDEAIDLKQRVMMAVGVINKKHNLRRPPEGEQKPVDRPPESGVR